MNTPDTSGASSQARRAVQILPNRCGGASRGSDGAPGPAEAESSASVAAKAARLLEGPPCASATPRRRLELLSPLEVTCRCVPASVGSARPEEARTVDDYDNPESVEDVNTLILWPS